MIMFLNKNMFQFYSNFFFYKKDFNEAEASLKIKESETKLFFFILALQDQYVHLNNYIFSSFSIQVFLFGLVGAAFNKRNFISILLSIEVMFLGLGLTFLSFSSFKYTLINFSIPVLILGVAASETAIGLAVLIFMYKYGWQTDNFLFKSSQISSSSKQNLINNLISSFSNDVSSSVQLNVKKESDCFFLIFLLFFNNDFLLMKNYEYMNILFFWITSFFFLILLVTITRYLSFNKPGRQKLSSYECGFEPFSDSRGKQDVLFYVVAILFILFDIELVFILPWAASYFLLPVSSYFLIFFFIFTLILGFAYEWRNGALNWITK